MEILDDTVAAIQAPIQILELIQRGGQGEVYKARLGRLRRHVALKVMHEEALDDQNLVDRFHTEAEAAARLGKHPNIVYVLHVGEWRGRPCVVLEYVAGGTLADRLDGEPQPIEWSANLTEVLARAVHYAHENGVIHRDLKPTNILLTTDGTPKVADWGIAKLLDEDRTQLGAILGSRHYMAPEVRNGRSRDADRRTDVYALGLLLYEALTGERPNTKADGVLMHPSWLRPGVPPELDDICLKCLAVNPDDRFATAKELADALQQFLSGNAD